MAYNQSPDILAIATEFERKIKEINFTFRSHFEEMLNKPLEEGLQDDEIKIPESIKTKLRSQINDLYIYILNNYKRFQKTGG